MNIKNVRKKYGLNYILFFFFSILPTLNKLFIHFNILYNT